MIVSVDPGRRSGIAWFGDKPGPTVIEPIEGVYLQGWSFERMVATKKKTEFRRALDVFNGIGLSGGDTLIIEDQWHTDKNIRVAKGQDARGNFASVKTLICIRKTWECAAEVCGAETHLAPPAVWMKQLAGSMPQKTPGERVRGLISSALLIRTSLDEAAAIGIGMWWIMRNRVCRS